MCAGAPTEPKGVIKTYDRPWLQHMRKPKEAPATQPDRPMRVPNPEIQVWNIVLGADGAEWQHQCSGCEPCQSFDGANVGVGDVMSRTQSYIAQKRAERLRAKREAKEEAEAAHQRPLSLRRLTSESARQWDPIKLEKGVRQGSFLVREMLQGRVAFDGGSQRHVRWLLLKKGGTEKAREVCASGLLFVPQILQERFAFDGGPQSTRQFCITFPFAP
eukprot:135668-Pelagomonas_calceolata.AAC.2